MANIPDFHNLLMILRFTTHLYQPRDALWWQAFHSFQEPFWLKEAAVVSTSIEARVVFVSRSLVVVCPRF